MKVYKVYNVLIDAGHGGHDAGLRYDLYGNMFHEKRIAYAYACQLASMFSLDLQYSVEMTRNADTAIPMTDRVDMVKQVNPNVLISVHASECADMRNAKTDCGVSLVYAIRSKRSEQCCRLIAEYMRSVGINVYDTGIHPAVYPEPVYYADPRVPAFIFNVGFMSNVSELDRLATPSYSYDLMVALYNGFSRATDYIPLVNPELPAIDSRRQSGSV